MTNSLTIGIRVEYFVIFTPVYNSFITQQIHSNWHYFYSVIIKEENELRIFRIKERSR